MKWFSRVKSEGPDLRGLPEGQVDTCLLHLTAPRGPLSEHLCRYKHLCFLTLMESGSCCTSRGPVPLTLGFRMGAGDGITSHQF